MEKRLSTVPLFDAPAPPHMPTHSPGISRGFFLRERNAHEEAKKED